MNSEHLPFSSQMSFFEWCKLFSENLMFLDLEEETAQAFIHYLKDLEQLVQCESDKWNWPGLSGEKEFESQIDIIREDLKRLAKTENGFAIPFFVQMEGVELPDLEKIKRPGNEKKDVKIVPKPEIASDFSNLQIVKKVGRQLKPFLDAENIIVGRLTGKHTCKKDARLLFQYIFGKVNSKAKPKKWEQLSRKRHR